MKLATPLLSLLLLLTPASYAHSPLKICYESPEDTSDLLSYRAGYEAAFGVYLAVVLEALETLQQPYELHQLPWRRCLAATIKGELDAVIGIGWTAERSQQFYYPYQNNAPDDNKRITMLDYYVYSASNSALTWDGKTFHHVKHGVATPSGYVTEQLLAELGVLQSLDSSIGAGLDLVINNRLDGYVLAKEIAELQLRNHPNANQIRQLSPAFYQQAIFMVFSQQSALLNEQERAAIWSELAKARLRQSLN